MILQELNRYYERQSSQDPNVLAPEGFERKEVSFVIVLSQNGELVGLRDVREGEGKKKRGVNMLMPAGVERSRGKRANLLWDNIEYVLGVSSRRIDDAVKKWTEENPEASKDHDTHREIASSVIPDKTNEKHRIFVSKIQSLNPISDTGVQAVMAFLEGSHIQQITRESNWPEILRSQGNLSFQLQGDRELVCQRSDVRDAIVSRLTESQGQEAFCLVGGQADKLAVLHPAIKGVWGGQTSGGKIVSFNEDAFCSQGKSQGENSTVGRSSAFRYTTALNHLLRSGSKQRLQVGDSSTVFWAAEETEMEDLFGEVFSDDPDRNIGEVRAALTSFYRGNLTLSEGSTRFFVLGLAPNASRISVRFWHSDTVSVLAEKLDRYFSGLEIIHSKQDSGFLPLGRLLRTTAVQAKNENINPRMAGELMRSILSGSIYPRSVLNGVIARIRADQNLSYPRAALLKAWLNRWTNLHQPQEKEMLMALDPNNINPGYRLGRLFAVMEKAQQEAIPGASAGIRDRYYGAASSTPASVYPTLLKNYPHHLGKLNEGRKINFERLVQSILSEIQDFPKLLSIEDQGRFAVGYYHQRQDLFTKKENTSPSTETENAESDQLETV